MKNRALQRSVLRFEDWSRVQGLGALRTLVSVLLGVISRRIKLTDGIARLLAAGNLRRSRLLSSVAIRAADQPHVVAGMNVTPLRLERSIVAKPWISARERGMLFVSFESELRKLLDSPSFREVEERYQICFLPTWQPAYSRELFELAARARYPYVIMPAAEQDLHLSREIGHLCVPVPLQAASWIPEDQFVNVGRKDIDIILLANFSSYKRHWKLFQGISQVEQPLKVVCAGRPWSGRTRNEIQSEAECFGVADHVMIVENPTNREVAELLARSRLFCAMSHKEGSFVAVAEALVANTPVGMFDNAIIGTKSCINSETGFLFSHRKPLGPQLIEALKRCGSMSPRTWACREITARPSADKFNRFMREQAQNQGGVWSRDIAYVYCRNFSFDYFSDSDAQYIGSAYNELRKLGIDVVLLSAMQAH